MTASSSTTRISPRGIALTGASGAVCAPRGSCWSASGTTILNTDPLPGSERSVRGQSRGSPADRQLRARGQGPSRDRVRHCPVGKIPGTLAVVSPRGCPARIPHLDSQPILATAADHNASTIRVTHGIGNRIRTMRSIRTGSVRTIAEQGRQTSLRPLVSASAP